MESSANKKFVIERIFGSEGQIQSLIILNEFSIKGNKVSGSGSQGKKISFKLQGTQKDGLFDINVECLQNGEQSHRLKGILEYEDVISGDWSYKSSESSKDNFDLESNQTRSLAHASVQIISNDRDKVIPQIPLSVIPCFCKQQIKRIIDPIDPSIKNLIQCKTCLSNQFAVYYSCSQYDTDKQCQFLMCYECYQQIEFINKMMLISRIRHAYRANKTEWFKYVNYVMEIFRGIFKEDPMTLISVKLHRDHDYRWYEIYEMTQDTFDFVKIRELELYTNREILGEGHFHQVYEAIQRRDFEQQKLQNGFIVLKEKRIDPIKKWVIKKVKKYNDLMEVPFDIAKQYIAVTLANRFNLMLDQLFPQEKIFLKYIQPYLAFPLYNQEIKYVFELEEHQETSDYIKFDNFSRPRGDKFSTVTTHEHFGQVRLPHAFSHWTFMVTGGLVMITDIQGWKVDVGQYVMTDPIVFSNKGGQLGNVDWGTQGMKNWIQNHECNQICHTISMERDEQIIINIQTYIEKFNSKKIQDIMFELDIIAGLQPEQDSI
ncbi:myosin heavy chain kinase a-like protein [Stylonychia lemnae]|uniref:Myosin heavy chain kinase a-like protein n=1 Tax=Stylonychia lemnae TaxID=5949 RepID=A0A077ZRL9_STYLE|nr:myosin heavy chain kinase a-like protein [Stylonychia lemnae]|eukprot:CDW71151.1 myosin heavy chain kinase a-like protein [Stylonychia lemnae]